MFTSPDWSRGLLLLVATIAALVGFCAHLATGEEIQPSGIFLPDYPRSKLRIVAQDSAEPISEPAGSSDGLKWRVPSSGAKQTETIPARRRGLSRRRDGSAEASKQTTWRIRWQGPEQHHARRFGDGKQPLGGRVQPASDEQEAAGDIDAHLRPAINLVPPEALQSLEGLRWAQRESRFSQGQEDPSSPPTSSVLQPPADAPALPELDDLPPLDEVPPAEDSQALPPLDETPRPGETLPPLVPDQSQPPLEPPLEPFDPDIPTEPSYDEPRPRSQAAGKDCHEYRNVDCCEEQQNCNQAWELVRQNRVRNFDKRFLDITPQYHPVFVLVDRDGDTREDLSPFRALDRVDWQATAPGVVRTVYHSSGMPLGVRDGEIFGLDGADWKAEFDRREEEARRAGLPPPERPADLNARVVRYQPGDSDVVVETLLGERFTIPVDKLRIEGRDAKFWLEGRPWRNKAGEVVARGRLHNLKWGRIYVKQTDGQITTVPLNELGDDEFCYVGAYWGSGIGLPTECRLRGTPEIRNFTLLTYTWKASALCHKPLYFEEPQLERYGHSAGPLAQPVISGAHFFANIAILPYKMGVHPPTECIYALGYYRPGSCAPYMIPPVPLSVRGALYQAGATVGAVAFFP